MRSISSVQVVYHHPVLKLEKGEYVATRKRRPPTGDLLP